MTPNIDGIFSSIGYITLAQNCFSFNGVPYVNDISKTGSFGINSIIICNLFIINWLTFVDDAYVILSNGWKVAVILYDPASSISPKLILYVK